MNNAYRDDLEAALARASDLEREVVALRKRCEELESGDRETIEARENARRLEAALVREREELRQRFENDLDAEIDRRRLELVRREHPVVSPARTVRQNSPMPSVRPGTASYVGLAIILIGAAAAIAVAVPGNHAATSAALCVFAVSFTAGMAVSLLGGRASDDPATRG